MLLDDVMSELDASRRERLVELVRGGGQTVVAATEPEHVPGAHDADVELLVVKDGAPALEAPHEPLSRAADARARPGARR